VVGGGGEEGVRGGVDGRWEGKGGGGGRVREVGGGGGGGQGSNKSLSTLAFTLAKLLLPPFLPSFHASAMHPLLVCDHDIITYGGV